MDLNEQLAGMVAPHSSLEAAVRRLMESGLWDETKVNRDKGRFAPKGTAGSRDLFGDELKSEPPEPERFENLGGRQQSLFGKRGLPGQRHLFSDAGVPDELVAKPVIASPPPSSPSDFFEYPSDPDFSMGGAPERIKRPSSGTRQVRQLVKDGIANPKAAEPILRALVGDDEFVEITFKNNYAKTPVDRLSALIDMAAVELTLNREKANPQAGRHAEVSQEEGVLFGSGMRNYVSVEDENEINKTLWDALRGVDRLGVLSADSSKIGEVPANIPVEQGPGGPAGVLGVQVPSEQENTMVSTMADSPRKRNALDELADKFKGSEFVAKHPKTGKWHGIDRVLRVPITDGFSSKDEAKMAWRYYNARAAGDIATQNLNV